MQDFVHTETTSGIALLAAAAVALVWANSPWSSSYEWLWNLQASVRVGQFSLAHSLREWINDALMVVFFFVVGLEVKREFMHGELSDRRRASLPVAAALGGMLLPALLYAVLNYSGAGARGWGIPMATDIAFALGVLALVGERIPATARVFLLALATVDDIGAIMVIAIFYTDHLSLNSLLAALALIGVIFFLRRFGVQNLLYYAPFALMFWFAVLHSGVHATIAGVVLGLITPTEPYFSKRAFARSAEPLVAAMKEAVANDEKDAAEAILGQMEELTTKTEAPADRLVRILHPWSSYGILPLFALANAGVSLTAEAARQAFTSPIARGIVLGLILGKLTGIVAFAWMAVRLRLARPLAGMSWAQMAGVGLLGGIGFTVSLFISDLAFTDGPSIAQAKLGIIVASLIAGAAGYLLLRGSAPESSPT
jgi:NhaA family Na+:H+ antiporter